MANFFKDYQKQVREKREAEQAPKREKQRLFNYFDNLDYGAKVQINPLYDHTEKQTGIKYFVARFGDSVLLADTKKQAINEHRGYLYSIYKTRIKGVNV